MVRKAMTGPATAYVAAEFRAQKARLRLSLDDVAFRSGLGRSTVDRSLTGESAIPVEVMLAICEALDLDPVTVLRGAMAAEG